MTKYKVYQDGKTADTSGYPEMHHSWSPEKNTHKTMDEAIKYAHLWAYKIYQDGKTFNMELNTPINMSMSEHPVMMEIRENEVTEITEIIKILEEKGFTPENLDDFVHDVSSRVASQINNEGMDSQVEFLMNHGYDLDGILHGTNTE